MNKIIIIASATLICLVSFSTMNASNRDTTVVSKGISISYWGTLKNNNGLQIGLEKYYLQTGKYKITGTTSLVLGRKPNVYTSAGIIAGSSLRRSYRWGLYFEQGITFGYLGSYYDFDFYKTNSDGNIVNVGRKWTSSIILGYSLGFGYDFAKKTNLDIQLFVKPNIYYRFPNNDNVFYLNNYSIEAGVILHPKFLSVK